MDKKSWKMRLRRKIQIWLSKWLSEPDIPAGKTTGFSLVRSERCKCEFGKCVKVAPPYKLNNVRFDDYTYVARNIDATNLNTGKFCSIGPNFCCGFGLHPIFGISTSFMLYSNFNPSGISFVCSDDEVAKIFAEHSFQETRITNIGNDVYIGANVLVLDGVTIGDGAVVGAGAVVTNDIPPYAVAVGVPAKVIKYRFDEITIKKLLEKKWWDGSEEELETVGKMEFRVKEYVGLV